jgi:transcriptional regulator with XRE-family HTH domain
MIDSAQVRAARALLNWRQNDIAEASGIGIATIQRIEKGDNAAKSNHSTLSLLRQTFERHGIQFLEADSSGGSGVRISKRNVARPREKRK